MRGAPPAQGGIQVLGALVGHVSVIMQRQFQQFVWTFQLHADLGTHGAHCGADHGDLTGTVLGMVVDAPVVVQRQVPWLGPAENCGVSAVAVLVGVVQFLDKVVVPAGAMIGVRAMLGSTIDTCYASSRVAFGRIVYVFPLEGARRVGSKCSGPSLHERIKKTINSMVRADAGVTPLGLGGECFPPT